MHCELYMTRPRCCANNSCLESSKISRKLSSSSSTKSIHDLSRLNNYRCSKPRICTAKKLSLVRREMEHFRYRGRPPQFWAQVQKMRLLGQQMAKRAANRLAMMHLTAA